MYKMFDRKAIKKDANLGCLCVGAKVVLHLTVKKQGAQMSTEFGWLRIRSLAIACAFYDNVREYCFEENVRS